MNKYNNVLVYICIAILIFYILRKIRCIQSIKDIKYNSNIHTRYKYYLGNFYTKSNIVINVNPYKEYKQDHIFYYTGPNQIVNANIIVSPGWWWGYNNEFYVNFPCLTNSADGYISDELPVLTKARIIENPYNGILIKYEYGYHWKILETFEDSYSWEDKNNSVCWRGNHITALNKKYNRRYFVEKYYQKYDIGFYPKRDDDYCKDHLNLFKNSMTQNEQLKSKYLICLEGNDVGTSLKWQLASNSIVLMAKPTIEGWLMEGLLEPYVHYVPLKDDLSDLDDIVKWCNNNDEACNEISTNARKHMEQFMDKDIELMLHRLLCKWYQKNVKHIL